MIHSALKRTMVAIAVMVALVTSGCGVGTPIKPMTSDYMEASADIKRDLLMPQADSGVLEAEFDAENLFVLRSLEKGDALPDKRIEGLSFNEQSVTDALRMLTAEAGISLSAGGTARGTADIYGSITVSNLAGNLPDVVEAMSESAGFFYSYRNGVLYLSQDRQFVLSLPPAVADDTYAGMTNVIQNLGGFGTYLDRQTRTLSFRANRQAMQRIDQYLTWIRENRHLIVYNVGVYQVDITDSSDVGIRWDNLTKSFKTGTFTLGGGALASGGPNDATGAAMGAALSDGNAITGILRMTRGGTSLASFVSFLQQYGNVRRLTQPRIAVLTGGEGYFRQGNSQMYVSRVGNNISTALSAVTVETSRLDTGIEMRLTGDVADNTIYTSVAIRMADLLRFTEYTALGTRLSLPETADREMRTQIRTRIGDMFFIGGITLKNDNTNASGLPGMDGIIALATAKAERKSRAEIVVVLQPQVVRFSAKKVVSESASVRNDAAAYIPVTPVPSVGRQVDK